MDNQQRLQQQQQQAHVVYVTPYSQNFATQHSLPFVYNQAGHQQTATTTAPPQATVSYPQLTGATPPHHVYPASVLLGNRRAPHPNQRLTQQHTDPLSGSYPLQQPFVYAPASTHNTHQQQVQSTMMSSSGTLLHALPVQQSWTAVQTSTGAVQQQSSPPLTASQSLQHHHTGVLQALATGAGPVFVGTPPLASQHTSTQSSPGSGPHPISKEQQHELAKQQAAANAQGRMIVVDPLSRKLRLPLHAVTPTRAQSRVGIPSLCLLFLKGQCRQGNQCHQVHANSAVVQQHREAAANQPTCCDQHGDVNGDSVLPLWRQLGIRFCVQGSVVVPLESVAYSAGLRRFVDDFLSQRSTGGTAVLPSVAFDGSLSDFAAVSLTGLTQLASRSSVDATETGSLSSSAHVSSTTIAADAGRSASPLAAEHHQPAAHQAVISLQVSSVCKLHGEDGGCRFAEDCKFLHVCRQIIKRDIAPLMALPLGSTSATASPSNTSLSASTGSPHGVFLGSAASLTASPIPRAPSQLALPSQASSPVNFFASSNTATQSASPNHLDHFSAQSHGQLLYVQQRNSDGSVTYVPLASPPHLTPPLLPHSGPSTVAASPSIQPAMFSAPSSGSSSHLNHSASSNMTSSPAVHRNLLCGGGNHAPASAAAVALSLGSSQHTIAFSPAMSSVSAPSPMTPLAASPSPSAHGVPSHRPDTAKPPPTPVKGSAPPPAPPKPPVPPTSHHGGGGNSISLPVQLNASFAPSGGGFPTNSFATSSFAYPNQSFTNFSLPRNPTDTQRPPSHTSSACASPPTGAGSPRDRVAAERFPTGTTGNVELGAGRPLTNAVDSSVSAPPESINVEELMRGLNALLSSTE